MILRSESSLSFFCCSITIANCCCNFSTSVLRKLSALSLAAFSSCSCSSNLFRSAPILRFLSSSFNFSAYFCCFRCERSYNTSGVFLFFLFFLTLYTHFFLPTLRFSFFLFFYLFLFFCSLHFTDNLPHYYTHLISYP